MPNVGKPVVALIGTLDTKQAEYQHAASWLERNGCTVLVFDASTRLPSKDASPSNLDLDASSKLYRPLELLEGDSNSGKAAPPTERSAVRDALRSACLHELVRLHKQEALHAMASFGGSQNTAFATSIMRDSVFPIGLPKFMLTTMASGDISEYIGESDICIMPSVGDISGSLNAITAATLNSALAAISGMAHARHQSASSSAHMGRDKPMVAISMFGVTTVAVNQISDLLKEKGYEPVAFHATGSGGRMMERLIREGFFKAVVDLTTTELCDHLYGGVLSAGPDRLIAAASCGVPQVVSVGALDMINFGSISTLPPRYELSDGGEGGPLHRTKDGTRVYEHNSQVTLVRTSPAQCKELGEVIVKNLLKGLGQLDQGKRASPVRIMFPRSGVSAMDGDEGVWDDLEARDALFESIRAALQRESPNSKSAGEAITLESYDHHVNSPEFARLVAQQVVDLVGQA